MRVKSLANIVPVRNIPFEIQEERVLRELRIPVVKSLKEMPEKNVAQFIKTAIDSAYTLIDGAGAYRTFKVVHKNGDAGIEESPTLFDSPRVKKLLHNCAYVTLQVSTIGPKLEDKVEEIKNSDASAAFYLEMVGGWMADYIAEKVDSLIEPEILKNGYARTMRYSPGYGDWELKAQAEVLRLLEGSKLGIRLFEDSYIMIPRKSVTAAIGWERKSN